MAAPDSPNVDLFAKLQQAVDRARADRADRADRHNEAAEPVDEPDPTPCCPDPDCSGQPCTFPGYAANH